MLYTIITPSKPAFDDAVKIVLSRPEYANLKSALEDIIQGIKEWFISLLVKFFTNLFSGLGAVKPISGALSTIFIVVALTIIVGIIVFIAIKINKSFEKKGKIKEILGERIDGRTTPDTLKAKAKAFEEKEDFRNAIRYDFIALLLLMHEKNVLYLDETRTNEENYAYLNRIKFPKLSEFHYAMEAFNSTWYGYKTCGRDGYGQWSGNISAMWNEVINYEAKI
jgi:hypothetical protein